MNIISPLVTGNWMIFKFWVTWLFKLSKELPEELTNQSLLNRRLDKEKKESFSIKAPKQLIQDYSSNMESLASEIKGLHTNHGLSFKKRQIGFWIIRLLTVLAAFSGNIFLCFLFSLLQFLLLPYSLVIAVGYGAETSLMLFVGHITVFPILNYICNLLLPTYLNVKISFSFTFLLLFLLADQIICFLCLIKTPKGKTKKVSKERIWESVWYGFLNCKTYYFILIPLLFGQNFPVTVWIIDYGLGLSTKISSYFAGHWECMFYHIHRIGHVNYVYPDAHKFHHYLRDATAFDAHIFGSGAPEEWLLLVVEYLIARYLCAGVPPSLSYYVLTVSWYNKWGFHSRNMEEKYHSTNFHADHHAFSNKNFGFEYPLEMVMNTTFDREMVYKGYKLTRKETEKEVVLQFTPC